MVKEIPSDSPLPGDSPPQFHGLSTLGRPRRLSHGMFRGLLYGHVFLAPRHDTICCRELGETTGEHVIVTTHWIPSSPMSRLCFLPDAVWPSGLLTPSRHLTSAIIPTRSLVGRR